MVKEAYRFAIPPLAIGVICIFFGWKWPAGILIFLGFFVFYFFRDPERTIPSDPGIVVSPADGRHGRNRRRTLDSIMGHRISIFLSIWDVHVQRAPVAGRIANVVYRPGKFMRRVSLRGLSRKRAERHLYPYATRTHGFQTNRRSHRATRAMLENAGEEVALGERVGMIRFGSRVDIWLPMEAEIVVKRGQKVKGGESVMAKWNSTP